MIADCVPFPDSANSLINADCFSVNNVELSYSKLIFSPAAQTQYCYFQKNKKGGPLGSRKTAVFSSNRGADPQEAYVGLQNTSESAISSCQRRKMYPHLNPVFDFFEDFFAYA